MLIELSRQQRKETLLALGTSAENKKYSEYFDYYNGDHFVRSGYYTPDGRYNHEVNIYTRSGYPVFDSVPDKNKVVVRKNWCRKIIDTVADYTRGVNEDIVVTSDTAKDKLSDVWKNNQINILTKEVACEAGMLGKTCLKLRQRLKGAPIEIFQVDPGGVHFIKNPLTDDLEGVIYYFIISVADAKALFPQVEITDPKEVYYAEEWTNDKLYKFIDGQQVNEINDGGLYKDGNPYAFIPFYEIKADKNSQSDIVDVIPLNDEYNMILTFNHESLKYHGFPMYSPDGSFDGKNIIPLTALKEVNIAPRTILNFPAKRIEAEGVSDSIINYIKELRTDISIAGSVPLKLLTAELDGNLSGVALQRLMAPLIKVAEDRRNYIKEAYKKINTDILTLLGAGEAETDIIFPDIIKIDTNERLDEALKKQTIGISKETIFEELGYDYQEEENKKQEEFNNSLEKRLRDEDIELQRDIAQIKKKGTKAQQGKDKADN